MPNEIKWVLLVLLVGFGAVIVYDIVDHLDHRLPWTLMAIASTLMTFGVANVHWFPWVFMIFLSGFLIFMAGYGYDSWIKPKPAEFVKLDTPRMYGRRDYDQEMADILKEAEKMRKELPLVTLWWGLDGLQMNRDGTLEWISKKPKPVEPYWLGPDLIHSYPIPTYPLACMRAYQPILYGLDCQNASPEDRISFLEAQERELTSAMAQSYQTRAILDNLKQWEVVNEEKGSYVKVTDILRNSYLEPCVWTHSQEKHTL